MSLDRDMQCREIITKAVCGKGRKFSHVSHTVTPSNAPSSILGAWIINNQYEAVGSGDGVEVVGSYDINIWYSYDRNTKTDVAKETVSYVEVVPLSYLDKKNTGLPQQRFRRSQRRNRTVWKQAYPLTATVSLSVWNASLRWN